MMKKSILATVAYVLGFGAGGVPDMPRLIAEPIHREPTKKQKRARAGWRLSSVNNSAPTIHTNTTATARRLRQIQSGILKPQSRNINAITIQATA